MHLIEAVDDTDAELPRKRVALCFDYNILNSFMTALQSSSATLTVALYVYATERGEIDVAFSVATILMVLTLLLNIAANLSASKLGHKEK